MPSDVSRTASATIHARDRAARIRLWRRERPSSYTAGPMPRPDGGGAGHLRADHEAVPGRKPEEVPHAPRAGLLGEGRAIRHPARVRFGGGACEGSELEGGDAAPGRTAEGPAEARADLPVPGAEARPPRRADRERGDHGKPRPRATRAGSAAETRDRPRRGAHRGLLRACSESAALFGGAFGGGLTRDARRNDTTAKRRNRSRPRRRPSVRRARRHVPPEEGGCRPRTSDDREGPHRAREGARRERDAVNRARAEGTRTVK